MRPESSWRGMAGDVCCIYTPFLPVIINWTDSSVINIEEVPVFN